MLERELGELTRRRVPCEQPLHMGESVLSRRRTPGFATTAGIVRNAVRTRGERESRSDSRTRSRVALSDKFGERHVDVPCVRKVARCKATKLGEADCRSGGRVICSG